jgi:hypothetical protein
MDPARTIRSVWQMGHTAGQCKTAPERSPSRGAVMMLDVVQLFGGAMPDSSPTTYRFDAGNKRRATAMRTGIVVLTYVVLCGNAVAATEYAVDGLAVGTQLNLGSASYREYKCSPSDQFAGLIWCQKARTDKERRGSYTAAYSLLHSQDGNISYVSRSQEPAFLNPKEVELNIQQYSRKIGESPRIIKMPNRSGLPDGLIAVWGKIKLEPLDHESIRILAAGKSPKKGFLIDYLRNFARSAKEGLPIYRIDGGPGFIWAASFDNKGRGTLRLAAVEVSGFSPPPAPVVVSTAAPTQLQELPSVEKLQADLAISINKIAELEKAKSDAELAVKEAKQAKLDAENAKQEVEQTRIAEKMTSDALVAQLRADEATAGAKTGLWETALYGSVGGLLVVLTTSTIGFFINRRKARVSKQPIGESIEASARCQNSRGELEPSPLSPGIAISEAAFERELEEEVATINAAQDATVLVGPSQNCVRGQLGAVLAHDRLGFAALAWQAIELPGDPDAGDRRVGQTFARAAVDQDEDTQATSGNSAAIMIASASWTKRLAVADASSSIPWKERAFGAIVVKIPTQAAPCPGARD